MKHLLILALVPFLLINSSYAQEQLTNGSFESWKNPCEPEHFYYNGRKDCGEWPGFHPIVQRTDDSFEGDSAILMSTRKDTTGTDRKAHLFGEWTFDNPTIKPTEFSFRYKYQPVHDDNLNVFLSYYDSVSEDSSTILGAKSTGSIGASVSEYTEIKFRISISNDLPSDLIPNRYFLSVYPSNGQQTETKSYDGTKFWMDDLKFIYETSGIEEFQNEKVEIYPNPTTNTLNISVNNESNIKELALFSLNGVKVKRFVNKQNNYQNLDVSDVAFGIYLIKIETENHSIITRKVVIN
ncbi:MAG: hypothetical protein ACJAZ3_000301 [Sphingobacteriales bacterium]